ncbi:MAG: hypothetical protein CFH06_01138 [Alphaproteobacteria bacterium MarineAlpha3_Bin5]|nr:MFS transporter [Magnetovibrio sp.]PPR77715.1 MAG: hypothetical protein CFH06_01138 [Alphaproteobacteria bacterium MarineAlpha3_Bin5]
MDIATFLRFNYRFLLFGLAAAFFSSFGQTFFISLSSQYIRTEYSLSHGEFGLIYSCGTLASACMLIWAGRQIDFMDLRLYTFIVCLGLAAFSVGMAFSNSVGWLLIIIFGLRFTGQGLLSHISSVSMARYFNKSRGAALSISSIGYPLGEAIFPPLAVATIVIIGWREMWLNIGILVILAVTPSMLWLLKGHTKRHAGLRQQSSDVSASASEGQWTQIRILKDIRFYIMLPSYLAIPFIGTGFFFHQVHLANTKGWDLDLFVNFFVVYAVCQTLAAISAGMLVDRFTARTVMKFYLLPAMIGLSVLSVSNQIWIAAIFMAFLGISSGAVSVANSAIWAEIYGVARLGSIKAMGTALMVLSTALSPPVMGIAIDAGVSMETLAFAAVCFFCSATAVMGFFFPKEYRGK